MGKLSTTKPIECKFIHWFFRDFCVFRGQYSVVRKISVKNAIGLFCKLFYIYPKGATIGFGLSDCRKLLHISCV